jgi:hypothetical protein
MEGLVEVVLPGYEIEGGLPLEAFGLSAGNVDAEVRGRWLMAEPRS